MNIEKSLRQFFSRWREHDQNALDIPYLCDGILELKLISYQKGSDYVGFLPTYYFSMRKAEAPMIEVGRCDLRVGMSREIPYAGHIGYRVWVSQRGRRYAWRASRLLMAFAHSIGIEEVLITCDSDNHPSRKTLERLRGRYDGIVNVPEDSACYLAGDRQKCQFWYNTADYLDVLKTPEEVPGRLQSTETNAEDQS